MFGRMGALYVFNCPLSQQQATKVFSLGASYNGVFFADPMDTGHASSTDVDLMQALSSSLLLSFNSTSRSGSQLFDAKLGPIAAVTDGVTSCWSYSFDQSINCIGGS